MEGKEPYFPREIILLSRSVRRDDWRTRVKSSRTHVLGTTCTILRVSDGSRRHTQAFGWTIENIVEDDGTGPMRAMNLGGNCLQDLELTRLSHHGGLKIDSLVKKINFSLSFSLFVCDWPVN